jgi:hypothetical protein
MARCRFQIAFFKFESFTSDTREGSLASLAAALGYF